MPFALVLLWLSVPYAARSWAILERSQEMGGVPLVFLLKTLIPLFAALMALQGVAQAIRAASLLIPAPQRGRVAAAGRRVGALNAQLTPPGSALRSEPPSPEGEGLTWPKPSPS